MAITIKPGESYGFFTDTSICIGCKACEVACKEWNQLQGDSPKFLADSYDNKRFNSPNDVAVDRMGRVYVSDPRYVGTEPRELNFEGVFLIDYQGFVIPLETTAKKPNGLALSPDEKRIQLSR